MILLPGVVVQSKVFKIHRRCKGVLTVGVWKKFPLSCNRRLCARLLDVVTRLLYYLLLMTAEIG